MFLYYILWKLKWIHNLLNSPMQDNWGSINGTKNIESTSVKHTRNNHSPFIRIFIFFHSFCILQHIKHYIYLELKTSKPFRLAPPLIMHFLHALQGSLLWEMTLNREIKIIFQMSKVREISRPSAKAFRLTLWLLFRLFGHKETGKKQITLFSIVSQTHSL